MKKLITIILILSVQQMFAQKPFKGSDSTKLINNQLFDYYGGVAVPRGSVQLPVLAPGQSSFNYLPESRSYFSSTSGTGIGVPGWWNTAIGDFALDSCNGCKNNTMIGMRAGRSITTAQDNIGIGWDVLMNNKGGSANFAAIQDALHKNINGSDNNAIGRGALYSQVSGSHNQAFGYGTMYYKTEGDENIAIGSYALGFLERGSRNTFVGMYAGEFNDGAAGKIINESTALGYFAGFNSPYSNSTNIGANTDVTGPNQFNYDNTIYGENKGTSSAKVTVKGDLFANSITISGHKITVDDNYLYVQTSSGIKWIPLQSGTPAKFTEGLQKPDAVYDFNGRLIGFTRKMK